MENVAAVEELEKHVRRRMPDVTFTIDPPASSAGSWWIDVQRYGRVASVEWKPGKGFGVTAPNGGYGEGVDFVVDDAVAAAEYVTRVLQPSSSEVDANAAVTDTRRKIIMALADHVDRVVNDTVHTTIERLLDELRKHTDDEALDVRSLESELWRIAKEVLAERRLPSAFSGSSSSPSYSENSAKKGERPS
jgi:hypothetical protein